MDKCNLPFEALLDYYEGNSDEAATKRAQVHLDAGCSICAERLAIFARLAPAMRKSQAFAHAPDTAMKQARALFRELRPAPEPIPLRELVARLVMSSRSRLAVVGARGGAGATLQSLFETDSYDIDIWQERLAEGSWYLMGQVLPKDGSDAITPSSVTLTPREGVGATVTPEGSEFHLPAVVAGAYALRLRIPSAEIVVPDLLVGQ